MAAKPIKKPIDLKWIMISGMAGLLLLCGVVYGVVHYEFAKEKQPLAEGFRNQIDAPLNKAIPPECRALLREMSELAGRPETTAGAAVLLVKTGESALADHQITEAEKKTLTLALDFVKAKKGAAGFLELGDFYAAQPEIGAIVKERTVPAPPIKPNATTTQSQSR